MVLAVCGLILLFAADDLLPRFVAGIGTEASWIGQVLGAAWLGLAALNWLSKGSVLGGIYGRPIVMANAIVYFVTTTVLIRAPFRGALVAALVPGLFAIVYGLLLFRGPFGADARSK
jgi:hypothetical protein